MSDIEKPHNPCATCGACCRSYVVPVNGYDVWLLSTQQRIPPEQFLVACPQEEPGFDGFRLDAERPSYGLALDKQGRFNPSQPCVFLMLLGEGHTRCGVYNERPSVCRAYPMSIWNTRVFQMPESLCPPGAWPEGEVQRPAWRTNLQRLYRHMDVYHEVVARWNARVASVLARNPGVSFTLHEYFSYLLNLYGKLDALNTQIGEEELERMQRSWPASPRPNLQKDEFRMQSGEYPWLEYLMAARSVIDSFYPEVEPQPILALMPTYEPSKTSPMPVQQGAKKAVRKTKG